MSNLFRNEYRVCKVWFQHDHSGMVCTKKSYTAEKAKQLVKTGDYKLVRKVGPFGLFTDTWPYNYGNTRYSDVTSDFPFLSMIYKKRNINNLKSINL